MNKISTAYLTFLVLRSLVLPPHSTGSDNDYYVKPLVDSECHPPDDEPCKTLDEYANSTQDFGSDPRFLFLPGFHELQENSLSLSYLNSFQMMLDPSIYGSKFEMIPVPEAELHLSCCDIILDSISSITLANLIVSGSDEHGVVVTNTMRMHQQVFIDRFIFYASSMSYYENVSNSEAHFVVESSVFDRSPLFLNCDSVVANSLVNLTIRGSHVRASTGAGVQISDTGMQQNVILDIVNTNISWNQQGGIVIDTPLSSLQITIQNTTIDGNIITSSGRGYSAALSVYSGVSNNTIIVVVNSRFLHNQDLRSQPTESVVYISRANIVKVADSVFQNNRGTAIRADNVENHLHLQGIIDFTNNTALQGAALALISTQMYIEAGTTQHGTQITFEGNHAQDVGGAIYVESTQSLYEANDPDTLTECFYYFPEFRSYHKYSVLFTSNKAANGGHHIYGASLKSYCVVTVLMDEKLTIRSYDQIIQDIFDIELEGAEDSPISSIPSRVCITDSSGLNNSASCANLAQIFMYWTVIPGEVFYLRGILVGAEFGTATGIIHAQFLPANGTKIELPSHLYSQTIDELNSAVMLNYSVFSFCKNVVLVLTATAGRVLTYGNKDQIDEDIQVYNDPGSAGIIRTSLLTTPIYINITLSECPLGFYLHEDTMGCECNPQICLSQTLVQGNCSNGTGGLYIGSSIWVNAYENGSTDVILHRECPFYYCKINSSIKVDLSDPDTQCAMNHAGRLCGGCIDGMTLVLGSNKCKSCNNNNNLALLIFFAAAGLILVFFIKVLNVTVSQGTINGLVFYANIVWAYESILFPNNTPLFLKLFIAWINLDFGIEACFTEGLTAFVKTWLQFAFPLYIWGIAGGIVLAAHHSRRMTRLLGNNSVQVLATLFLLSYAKLLRAVITALMPATLYVYTENGTALSSQTKVVWAFDGNLEYGHLPHIFLLILALLVLIILWLPCTFVLLFIQPLRSHSNCKFLNWINTLKPLLDAYVGYLKPANRYWIGLLLLARFILFLTFTFTYTSSPMSSMLALNVTVVLLLALLSHTGQLYNATMKLNCHYFKSEISFQSILEVSFLFNLAVVGGSVIYVDESIETKNTVIYMSVSVAFLEFIGIVLYHFWCAVKPYYILKATLNQRHGYQNLDRDRDNVTTPTTSTIDMGANGTSGHGFDKSSEVREPILTESPI